MLSALWLPFDKLRAGSPRMDLAGLGRTFPAEGLVAVETYAPGSTHKGYPSRGWADRGWKAGRRMRRDPSEDLG